MRCIGLEHEKGFSLVELLVAMIVGSLILALVCSTFLFQQKTYDVQGQLTDMIQSARATMDIMTREIRMAGYDPAEANFTGVPYSTTQLQVLADLNADGDTSDMEESITYAFDSYNYRILRTCVVLNGGSPPALVTVNAPLATEVEAFDFAYLDEDGSSTTSAADIRQIQIIMRFRTKNPDPDYENNNGYRTYTLTSIITPKNLKLL